MRGEIIDIALRSVHGQAFFGITIEPSGGKDWRYRQLVMSCRPAVQFFARGAS